MFGWQIFINESLGVARITGVLLAIAYVLMMLMGQARFSWLSVAVVIVGPILLGIAVAALFAYCRWVERAHAGLLRWILAAVPLAAIAVAIVWMFRR